MEEEFSESHVLVRSVYSRWQWDINQGKMGITGQSHSQQAQRAWQAFSEMSTRMFTKKKKEVV